MQDERAFVLSSGGNLGSIQAGMALALCEAGLTPGFLVGTSVGAINAAVLAGDPTLEGAMRLRTMWHHLGWRDVFPISPVRQLRLLLRWRSFFPAERFRQMLRDLLPYERIEDAAVPLKIVATRVCDGACVVFDRGSVVDAVLASTALPGLFPPHLIADGHRYVDGAFTDRIPLTPAVDAGVGSIYVLASGAPCPPPIDTHLGALRAGGVCCEADDPGCASLSVPPMRVIWMPTLCVKIGAYDFTKSAGLLEKARVRTKQFLAEGGNDTVVDLAALKSGRGGVAVTRRQAPSGRAATLPS